MAEFDLFTHILDPHLFAHSTGYKFRGLSLTEKVGGWNIVLRGFDRDGAAYYAMTFHEEPLDGLRHLWEALVSRNGHTMWRLDKFFTSGG